MQALNKVLYLGLKRIPGLECIQYMDIIISHCIWHFFGHKLIILSWKYTHGKI